MSHVGHAQCAIFRHVYLDAWTWLPRAFPSDNSLPPALNMPTFTSILSLLLWTILTTVGTPTYIDITADASHSSAPNLHIAHLITSLGTVTTVSNTFSRSTNTKYEFLAFHSKFLLICLMMNIASIVPLSFMKPNCMSSVSICCLILCSKTFSTTCGMLQQLYSTVHWVTLTLMNW